MASHFAYFAPKLAMLAGLLANNFDRPVLDETGLEGSYSFNRSGLATEERAMMGRQSAPKEWREFFSEADRFRDCGPPGIPGIAAARGLPVHVSRPLSNPSWTRA